MKVSVLSQDVLFREGLLNILAHQAAFRVTGSADSLASIVQMARESQIDIALIDENSLTAKDSAAIKKLREGQKVRVVVIASDGSKGDHASADVTVRRSSGTAGLIQGLRQAAGEVVVSVRESMPYYGTYPRMLTPREHEVAQLVAQGMPNRRIAAILGLREQSIKNLVSTVMRKLDCENRVQVALRLTTKGYR